MIVGSSKPLRKWQANTLRSILEAFQTERVQLVEACTGAGKTRLAVEVAVAMLRTEMVKQVIVLSPSAAICEEWGAQLEDAARDIVRLATDKLECGDANAVSFTYQGASKDGFEAKLNRRSIDLNVDTLVIPDEIHHPERDKAWGKPIDMLSTKPRCKFLMLTGTPWKSEGEIALLGTHVPSYYIPDPNHDGNKIVEADFRYRYAEDIKEEQDRATVVCHFHFIDIKEKHIDGVKAEFPAPKHPEDLAKYEDPNCKIRLSKLYDDEVQRKALEKGVTYLEQAREDADWDGVMGLIVARNITECEIIETELDRLDQTYRTIHSEEDGSLETLRAIKDGQLHVDWILSVGMVSEGVDIPKLKVLVYLSGIMTLLYLIQTIGRILRRFSKIKNGPWLDEDADPNQTAAHVVMVPHPFLIHVASMFEIWQAKIKRPYRPLPLPATDTTDTGSDNTDQPKSPIDGTSCPGPGLGTEQPSYNEDDFEESFHQVNSEVQHILDQEPFVEQAPRTVLGDFAGTVLTGQTVPMRTQLMLDALMVHEAAKQTLGVSYRTFILNLVRNEHLGVAEADLIAKCKLFGIDPDNISPQVQEKQFTHSQKVARAKANAKKLTTQIKLLMDSVFNGQIWWDTKETQCKYKWVRGEINKAVGIRNFTNATLEEKEAWVKKAEEFVLTLQKKQRAKWTQTA